MQDLPINSDVGLAVVAAYLVIKELVGAIKKPQITVHPDTDLKEALTEIAKVLAVQSEILRQILGQISENQKDIEALRRERNNCSTCSGRL